MFFSLVEGVSLCLVFRVLFLIFQRRQFLILLLVLESIALLFLGLILFSSFGELMMVFITLSMAACEASLGLSLLVCITRHFGTDRIGNLVINK